MTTPARDDLALPRLRAFLQRRGGRIVHAEPHDPLNYTIHIPGAVTLAERDELRRLADAARVENLAVIGPVEVAG